VVLKGLTHRWKPKINMLPVGENLVLVPICKWCPAVPLFACSYCFFCSKGAHPAAFDKNSCGRAHVIQNICYGGRALIYELRLLCMRKLSRKTTEQTCGSRLGSVYGSGTETRQKSNIFNLLAAVLHKNKRNAPGNSEKVVYQGRNEGGKGGIIPRASNHYGGAELL